MFFHGVWLVAERPNKSVIRIQCIYKSSCVQQCNVSSRVYSMEALKHSTASLFQKVQFYLIKSNLKLYMYHIYTYSAIVIVNYFPGTRRGNWMPKDEGWDIGNLSALYAGRTRQDECRKWGNNFLLEILK